MATKVNLTLTQKTKCPSQTGNIKKILWIVSERQWPMGAEADDGALSERKQAALHFVYKEPIGDWGNEVA